MTGGTSGIGKAVAEELSRRRVAVLAVGLPEPQVSTDHDASTGVSYLCRDLATPSSVDEIVSVAFQRWNAIDILVNAAAFRRSADLEGSTLDMWTATLAVNLTAPFLLCKAVARVMAREGRGGVIINVGSGAKEGRSSLAAYSASKGGLSSLTRSLATELAPHNIRVNEVVPGITETGLTRGLRGEGREQMLERARRNSVSGRPNTPQEVALCIAWLCSPEAAVLSGACVNVGTLPVYRPYP